MFAAATDAKLYTLATIMIKILQIIIFFRFINCFGCDCDTPTMAEKYIQSDFVAIVNVTKIYPNKPNERGYKADIEINELFKGEQLKSIYIYGRSDRGIGSSCDIFIPENTKLIVYARKNKEGNYGIGMCSGHFNISQNKEFATREFEILKMFKSKNINYTDKTTYRKKATLSSKLEEFKGIKLKKKYAIYSITFSSDLKIKSIDIVSGFDNSIDQKLIEILWQTEWRSYNNPINNIVKEDSKLLFGFYYYDSSENQQSFLSEFYQ